MKARCINPNDKDYPNYGGRSVGPILMHEPWLTSLRSFIEDVEGEIGPRPPGDMTIDRINVNGHYEPGNIRWLPRSQQPANRRRLYNETEVAQLLAEALAQHHCDCCGAVDTPS